MEYVTFNQIFSIWGFAPDPTGGLCDSMDPAGDRDRTHSFALFDTNSWLRLLSRYEEQHKQTIAGHIEWVWVTHETLAEYCADCKLRVISIMNTDE